MDIKVLKKDKNELVFEVLGDTYTMSSFLQSVLLEDKDVSFAAFEVKGLDSDAFEFVLKTKNKDAKEVLDNAVKKAKKMVSDFSKKALACLSNK